MKAPGDVPRTIPQHRHRAAHLPEKDKNMTNTTRAALGDTPVATTAVDILDHRATGTVAAVDARPPSTAPTAGSGGPLLISVVLDRHEQREHPMSTSSGTDGTVCVTLRNRNDLADLYGALAHDILTQLGHEALRSKDTTGGKAAGVVVAYLRAHSIADLIIRGTERLAFTSAGTRFGFLNRLEMLARSAGLSRVWLLGEAPLVDARLTQLASDEAAIRWRTRTRDAVDRVRPPSALTTRTARREGFPAVPGDSALTFLTSVEELLNNDDARQVTAAARAAAEHANRECAPYLPGGPRHQRGIEPTEWTVHYVRTALEHTHDVNHAVAVLRGVQLALFQAGWWVTVDIDDFVNTYLASPAPPAHQAADWAQLMTYRTPHLPAISALAAAGVSRAGLEVTTPAHLGPGYSWVREGWRRHPVPAPARFYLHVAHQLLRATAPHGVDPRTLPLASLIDQEGRLKPANSEQVSFALAAPRNDLHLQLYGRPRAWAHRNELAWSRHWHVGVRPISEDARAAAKTQQPWRAA
jgi:hypothetical protein